MTSHEQLTAILDFAPDRVFVWRADTFEYVYMNAKGAAALGYEPGQWAGRTPMDDDLGFDVTRFRNRTENLLNGSEKYVTYERSYEDKYFYSIRIICLRPEGEVPLFVVYMRDISALRKTERARAEFLANVSHELKTPLTSIKGALALVASETQGSVPPKVKSLIKLAADNSERLNRLVQDILDFEKLERGQLPVELQPTDLGRVVHKSVDSVRSYSSDGDVSVALGEVGDDLNVKGNDIRIMQVLDNLISNAIKYSPSGGKVVVGATRTGDNAVLSVTDNGEGIPKKLQPLVFEKFSQGPAAERGSPGTGLGLSIARSLVEAHKGRIWFNSSAGGTTFYVSIPIAGQETSS